MLGLRDLFDRADLTPHGFCLSWKPELLWLQIAPDTVIGLSYYSIPLALTYFACKRGDIAFSWLFWMFAVFILACGTTHFFEIWTLWHPDYVAQGVIKVATAVVSLATAIIIWPVLPRLLALPSLAQINETLSIEINERTNAVEALQREMGERQRAEETLRQSQKMEGLGELTGGVAHDFNNLLMILQAQLYLLRRRGVAPGNESSIAAMEDAVAHGESLTRRLLSFARRQTLQPRLIDPREELPRLTNLMQRSLRGDIEIRLDIAQDIWRIEVDPNELQLALINIASNARNAMEHSGTLTVQIANVTLHDGDPNPERLTGDFVRLDITDTGRGISGEIIDRIFEPFFTTKEPGAGTGLGLAQVYGFTRQSGGAVTATSVPGQGTTITLYLPRSTAHPSVTQYPAEDPSSDPARQEKTVLLVEDNPNVAEVGALLLRDVGYRVTLAENACRALSLVMSGKSIDLVFSDIIMPGTLNGVDLARRLREQFPRLPVLLTTGYSAEARNASQEGFAILTKPYRADQLYRTIRDLLRPPPSATEENNLFGVSCLSAAPVAAAPRD